MSINKFRFFSQEIIFVFLVFKVNFYENSL
jgi:hypothetical protein